MNTNDRQGAHVKLAGPKSKSAWLYTIGRRKGPKLPNRRSKVDNSHVAAMRLWG